MGAPPSQDTDLCSSTGSSPPFTLRDPTVTLIYSYDLGIALEKRRLTLLLDTHGLMPGCPASSLSPQNLFLRVWQEFTWVKNLCSKY